MEWTMALSTGLLLLSAAVLLLGLWACLRKARGGARVLLRVFGTLLVVLAISLASTGVLLRQYGWLMEDSPAATLELRQLAPQRYHARLTATGREPREFELAGDEWQLDARVIRWNLPGQLAGLSPVYRFERLSGRYGDPKQELALERSVHDLREGWDFWEVKQRWFASMPIADARWGSAAYLPMLDGARFEVYVSPRGGLVAKPADEATERLLDEAGW